MKPKIKIFPSLLSADFSRLGEEVVKVEQAGADGVHFDIMDGHFVPNLALSAMVLQSLRKTSTLCYDAHLMVTSPRNYISAFAEAGAELIYIHPEAESPVAKTLSALLELGVRPGLALNPDTPAEVIKPYLAQISSVLVMTVYPGFPAQAFIASVVPKITAVRSLLNTVNPGLDLAVDGGINPETAPLVINAGANVLIAGNAIFKAPDYREAIHKLRSWLPGS